MYCPVVLDDEPFLDTCVRAPQDQITGFGSDKNEITRRNLDARGMIRYSSAGHFHN